MTGGDARPGAADVYDAERIAWFRSTGDWRDRTVGDLLLANARDIGERDAVVDRTRRCTWGQLAASASRVAAGLVELGLQRGDFVAIQLPNRVEFCEAYHGAVLAGLRVLTLMPSYREADVRFMLGKTRARAVITVDTFAWHDHAAMAMSVKDQLADLDHVVVLGRAPAGSHSYADLARPGLTPDQIAERALGPDELSRVAFTSGTTGIPKGAMHTHNTDLVSPAWMARVLGLDRRSHVLVGSPISHVAGLVFGVLQTALCGSTLVLQERWNAEAAVELIGNEQVAVMISSCIFAAELIAAPNANRDSLRSLKNFVAGGSSIPPDLVAAAFDRAGVTVLRSLGMTEAPVHIMNRPGDAMERLTNFDGRLIDGAEAKVVAVGDRSRTLPPGEEGEFATRGPHVFLGYLDEPQLTAEARSPDGWCYSGDLVRVDESGYYVHCGRIKDIINRGGIKISAAEVESILQRHPAVREGAAVPMPDERLGERTCAFAVLESGATLTLKDVVSHFSSLEVTRHKWPERLVVIGALPRNSAGKVDKAALRTLLAEDRDGLSAVAP